MTVNLPLTGFADALAAAQAALAARGSGERETWRIPAGRHLLAGASTLGADGLSLSLDCDPGAVLITDGALTLIGHDVAITGLTLEAADQPAALAIAATGSARLEGCVASGAAEAIAIAAPSIRLRDLVVRDSRRCGLRLTGFNEAVADGVTITGLTSDEAVSAFAATGAGRLTLKRLRVDGLDGPSTTGLAVDVGALRLQNATVTDLAASEGPAIGLDLLVRGTADLADVTVRRLRGVGVADQPFEELSGDGANAVRLAAAASHVSGVAVTDLEASVGRAVALRLPDDVEAEDLAIARALPSEGLTVGLAALQGDIDAAPQGTDLSWTIPEGVFRLEEPIALNAPGRGLALRGTLGGAGGTTLLFEAEGGGPLVGDVTGLTLSGRTLTLADLTLRHAATGSASAADLSGADRVDVANVTLAVSGGGSATALAVADADEVHVYDVTVEEVAAADGDATGVSLAAGRIVVADAAIEQVSASQAATGLLARASLSAHLSAVRATNLTGSEALGVLCAASGEDGNIIALDVRVEALAGSGDALTAGIALIAANQVEARAIGVSDIVGGRTLGALISAGASLDWLGGRIETIEARTAGAAAVRLVGGAGPALDDGRPNVAVRDVLIDGVFGAGASGSAIPADSWLMAAPTLAADLAVAASLAALPGPGTAGHVAEIVGLAVHAPVADAAAIIDGREPGSVAIEDNVIRRISGTALQVDAALRDLSLRASEMWNGVAAGWIDAERAAVANLTVHRFASGLETTTTDVEVFNTLATGIEAGQAFTLDAGGELAGKASFVDGGSAPLSPSPDPLPYIDPGTTGAIPQAVRDGGEIPAAAVDLALAEGDPLHEEAVTVPGDDPLEPVHMGAWAPPSPLRCTLVDPAPPPLPPVPAPIEPSPIVDYKSRDAASLLTVMRGRASVSMADWVTDAPADFTRTIMELLAAELDHLAYRQEEAAANAYLATATLARALHDHARLVDHAPDAGHSATAMIRFAIDDAGAEALGLTERFATGGTLTIPRDTLVVNPDFNDESLIFATEDDLVYDPRLDGLTLADGEDVVPGDLSAILSGDVADLVRGRWLTLIESDPDAPPTPAHVVRVTGVEQGTDRTRITFDPRRPAPARYLAATTVVSANVVPAWHGVPVTPLPAGGLADGSAQEDPLRPWRELLRLAVPPANGSRLVDVALPMEPVSRLSPGWPFPGEDPRLGGPDISAELDGAPVRLVDDLSDDAEADLVMALRPTRGGHAGLTLANVGDGGELAVSMRVGLGTLGNVGRDALTRVLSFGPGADLDAVLADRADRLDTLRSAIRVTNDLPARGGRDPTPLETLRAEAPLSRRRGLSAVAPRDYERLLAELPEVRAVRATAHSLGIRRVMRVTLLLADEDELSRPEDGALRQAERLRRWALARAKLADVRLMGFDALLVPPEFVPLDIDLVVDLEPWAKADTVRLQVEGALKGPGGLFDPDVSGLGGDVSADAVTRCVLAVAGVRSVRILRLRRLSPHAPDYADRPQMPIGDTEVAVINPPYGEPAGVLTVTTCGGMQ